MNCKPGDLAMYVGTHAEYRGCIVRVIKAAELNDIERRRAVCPHYWLIEPALDGKYRAADSALRPIRDPGEDAKDETLQWLPAPRREEELA